MGVQPRKMSRRKFLAMSAALAFSLANAGRPPSHALAQRADVPAKEDWAYLSDLEWDDATTGWLGIANEQAPARNGAFHGGAITLNSASYEKGIGAYPLSEITYSLDGNYLEFDSDIGLDATAGGSDASVRFLVFADDALMFESGYMAPDDPPQQVQVALAGARRLRSPPPAEVPARCWPAVRRFGRIQPRGSGSWGANRGPARGRPACRRWPRCRRSR